MKKEIVKLSLLIYMLVFMVIPLGQADTNPQTRTYYAETTDGNLKGYTSSGSYLWLWNYTDAYAVQDSLNEMAIGQKKEVFPDELTAYSIWRTVIFFDTHEIPNSAKILSAELKIWGTRLENDRAYNITVQKGTGSVPHEPLESGDYWQGFYSGSYGLLSSNSFLVDSWNVIELSSFELISITEKTRLVLRSSLEIEASEPPSQSFEYVTISTGETEYAPILKVTYITEGVAGGKPPTVPPPFGWRPWQLFSLQALLIAGFIGFFPLLITRLKKTSGAKVQRRRFKVIEKKLGRLRWKK